jgi:5,10-methylenetetrahydrofolate reductase
MREALDGFLSCDPSFKHVTIDCLEKMEQTKLVPIVLKARKAMEATESNAAEYRKQIENEALERAKQVCLKGDFRIRHMGDLDATYPEIHTPLHACVALAERIESLKG